MALILGKVQNYGNRNKLPNLWSGKKLFFKIDNEKFVDENKNPVKVKSLTSLLMEKTLLKLESKENK